MEEKKTQLKQRYRGTNDVLLKTILEDQGSGVKIVETENGERIELPPVKQHPHAGKKFGKPFEPGHKPMNHRSPKQPISLMALLIDELNRIPTLEEDAFDGEGKTNAWWMIHYYVRDARDSNLAAAKDILDRILGKPTQTITGPGGGPLQVDQRVEVISQEDLLPALTALMECGAITLSEDQYQVRDAASDWEADDDVDLLE